MYKYNAQQVMNGAWGEVWIDGDYMTEVTAFEAKVSLGKTNSNMIRRLAKAQKITGFSCSGSLTMNKVSSFLKSIDENEFKSGIIKDSEVAVTYKGLSSSYKMQDGKKIKAFDALEIEIVEVLSEEILLFDDTKIEVWECVFNTEYRLQDGTEL